MAIDKLLEFIFTSQAWVHQRDALSTDSYLHSQRCCTVQHAA